MSRWERKPETELRSRWFCSTVCKCIMANILWLMHFPCVLLDEKVSVVLFLGGGGNDNRPQAMADAWPSLMWNCCQFPAVSGNCWLQRRSSAAFTGWLDRCDKMNKILWLKSLHLCPPVPSTRASEKITSYRHFPLGVLPYLIFRAAHSDRGLTLPGGGGGLYLQWVFSEDWRNDFQSGRRDRILNAELRFSVAAAWGLKTLVWIHLLSPQACQPGPWMWVAGLYIWIAAHKCQCPKHTLPHVFFLLLLFGPFLHLTHIFKIQRIHLLFWTVETRNVFVPLRQNKTSSQALSLLWM